MTRVYVCPLSLSLSLSVFSSSYLHKRVMRQHHPFIAPGGLGAKKKGSSGRSPEILTPYWPFGPKSSVYKLPSCSKDLSKRESPVESGPRGPREPKVRGGGLQKLPESSFPFICRYAPLGRRKSGVRGAAPKVKWPYWPQDPKIGPS